MKKRIENLDEFINEKKEDKLVQKFKEYLNKLGYKSMYVWVNEIGLFAHLSSYVKKPDGFSQIFNSDQPNGTIVRLSHKDLDNEKIVGNFDFKK